MRNEYPGVCYRCGKTVESGKGHFERIRRGDPEWNRVKWRLQHADCAIRHRGTFKGKPWLQDKSKAT
jgi:hypothetical protein